MLVVLTLLLGTKAAVDVTHLGRWRFGYAGPRDDFGNSSALFSGVANASFCGDGASWALGRDSMLQIPHLGASDSITEGGFSFWFFLEAFGVAASPQVSTLVSRESAASILEGRATRVQISSVGRLTVLAEGAGFPNTTRPVHVGVVRLHTWYLFDYQYSFANRRYQFSVGDQVVVVDATFSGGGRESIVFGASTRQRTDASLATLNDTRARLLGRVADFRFYSRLSSAFVVNEDRQMCASLYMPMGGDDTSIGKFTGTPKHGQPGVSPCRVGRSTLFQPDVAFTFGEKLRANPSEWTVSMWVSMEDPDELSGTLFNFGNAASLVLNGTSAVVLTEKHVQHPVVGNATIAADPRWTHVRAGAWYETPTTQRLVLELNPGGRFTSESLSNEHFLDSSQDVVVGSLSANGGPSALVQDVRVFPYWLDDAEVERLSAPRACTMVLSELRRPKMTIGCSGFSFNGSQHVVFPHNQSHVMDVFTISIWFQAKTTEDAFLISKNAGSARLDHLTNGFSLAIHGGNLSVALGNTTLRGGWVRSGAWHMALVTYDAWAQEAVLFLDSEVVAQAPVQTGLGRYNTRAEGNMQPWVVGADAAMSRLYSDNNLDVYFTGILRYFVVFNQALNVGQVVQLFKEQACNDVVIVGPPATATPGFTLANGTLTTLLNVTGDAVIEGSTVIMTEGGGAPLIVVGGVATISGVLTINLVDAPVDGQVIELVQAGGFVGTFSMVDVQSSALEACQVVTATPSVEQGSLSATLSVDNSRCGLGLELGAIIGIAVGAVALAALLVLVGVVLHKRRVQKITHLMNQEIRNNDMQELEEQYQK